MGFIAAFSFDILINDSIFIEKYGKMILDLKQLLMINLRRSSYIPTEQTRARGMPSWGEKKEVIKCVVQIVRK